MNMNSDTYLDTYMCLYPSVCDRNPMHMLAKEYTDVNMKYIKMTSNTSANIIKVIFQL